MKAAGARVGAVYTVGSAVDSVDPVGSIARAVRDANKEAGFGAGIEYGTKDSAMGSSTNDERNAGIGRKRKQADQALDII